MTQLAPPIAEKNPGEFLRQDSAVVWRKPTHLCAQLSARVRAPRPLAWPQYRGFGHHPGRFRVDGEHRMVDPIVSALAVQLASELMVAASRLGLKTLSVSDRTELRQAVTRATTATIATALPAELGGTLGPIQTCTTGPPSHQPSTRSPKYSNSSKGKQNPTSPNSWADLPVVAADDGGCCRPEGL
jgi:hypothetical protein